MLYFCSALKVHPDKNNHPKADIAFKLIHEVSYVIFLSHLK